MEELNETVTMRLHIDPYEGDEPFRAKMTGMLDMKLTRNGHSVQQVYSLQDVHHVDVQITNPNIRDFYIGDRNRPIAKTDVKRQLIITINL